MYNRWVDRPPPRPSAGGNRAQPAPKEKRPPVQRTDGLQSLLNGLLGGKLDTSDIILLLILLLLYMDSGDEDFLIMLIVIALSI